MDYWLAGIVAYLILAAVTSAPIWSAALRGVALFPGGSSFEESTLLSEQARLRLTQHYSRIHGTLRFWKSQAELYKRLHYYCLVWTIPSSVMVPFLAQAMTTDAASKWLVTVIAAYTAILLSIHRAFKVDANYKAFRQGESEFYDLYRRLLDRPTSFGRNEEEELEGYFEAVDQLRKSVRNAETDNMPTIDELREIDHAKRP